MLSFCDACQSPCCAWDSFTESFVLRGDKALLSSSSGFLAGTAVQDISDVGSILLAHDLPSSRVHVGVASPVMWLMYMYVVIIIKVQQVFACCAHCLHIFVTMMKGGKSNPIRVDCLCGVGTVCPCPVKHLWSVVASNNSFDGPTDIETVYLPSLTVSYLANPKYRRVSYLAIPTVFH